MWCLCLAQGVLRICTCVLGFRVLWEVLGGFGLEEPHVYGACAGCTVWLRCCLGGSPGRRLGLELVVWMFGSYVGWLVVRAKKAAWHTLCPAVCCACSNPVVSLLLRKLWRERCMYHCYWLVIRDVPECPVGLWGSGRWRTYGCIGTQREAVLCCSAVGMRVHLCSVTLPCPQ